MHYETKNQKVHRTKEQDSHITESGFLLYIDSCFLNKVLYDIELPEKFIWMCIHTVSMHKYINYILAKQTERNYENCIINVWLHIYCIMMAMYYKTASELL